MRRLLPELNRLSCQRAACANFLFIYIQEAHALDEWPVGATVSTRRQHQTLAERLAAAAELQDQIGLPMLIDAMDNNFQQSFAAWPFRYYVVSQGSLILKAQPAPSYYNLDALHEWLDSTYAT